MLDTRQFLSVMLALALTGAGITYGEAITAWRLPELRTEAFSGASVRYDVSAHPASDPHYQQNRVALQKKQLLLATHEILEKQAEGTYLVSYPKNKLAVYSADGKTLAVGYQTSDSYPFKRLLYHYPLGKLKSITLAKSPADLFVFDAEGRLVSGSVETEQKNDQRRVIDIGLRLLNKNNIHSRVTFHVVKGSERNAGADETDNTIAISKALVDLADSDDEIAAVLAHEISHIVLHHGRIYPHAYHEEDFPIISYRGFGVRLPEKRMDSFEFGKAQEKEMDADRFGLRLMAKAGYRPEAMVDIYGKFMSDGSNSDYSTHPAATHRLKAIEIQIRKMVLEKAQPAAAQ